MNKIVKILQQTIDAVNRWIYRTFRPSNRLIIRNITKNWIDRDVRLFHANFTIVCDFVDQEMGGESGIERYVTSLRREVKTTTDQQEQTMLKSNASDYQKILELYRWYNSINWQNPVPFTPEYSKMIEQAEYLTTPTEHGAYRLQINHPDKQAFARARADQALREQQFEKLKFSQLQQICKIYHRLWN